jgi:hypothetical protein
VTTYIAPSCNISPEHGLRFGISFDNQPPVIVDTFRLDQDGFHTDKEWSDAVMDNICLEKTTHTVKKEGSHTLKIWMVDPGIVLQKIVIYTGGEKECYLGPPESYYNGKKMATHPARVSFDPGTSHTLTIERREDETKIDEVILITSSGKITTDF